MKPPNKINKKVTNEDREKTLGKSTAELAEECLTHLQQGVPYSTNPHTPKNPAAVALGRLGGSKKSVAKAVAARKNGLKGGRPKK